MNYLSTFETAERWGITPRRVLDLIRSGRIPEAKYVSSRWMIPENLPKPIDGRTKAGKEAQKNKAGKQTEVFRFPTFGHQDISAVDPPLNEAELRIKAILEAYNACRFQEADALLGDMPETEPDRYYRIMALYAGCMLDMFLNNVTRFFRRYASLRTELLEDFPLKTEMQEYLHNIDLMLGEDKYYASVFTVDATYPYQKSFLPRLASLCAISVYSPAVTPDRNKINMVELICILLGNSDSYIDLQNVHIYLGNAYTAIGSRSLADYHFTKALELAEKYDLFFYPAIAYYYSHRSFTSALSGFSGELKDKLNKCSSRIHSSYLQFLGRAKLTRIYGLLGKDEYIYLLYAVQGLTNKEVAARLNLSIGTVGKRYGEIYASLDVRNKQEMIALYHQIAEPAAENAK